VHRGSTCHVYRTNFRRMGPRVRFVRLDRGILPSFIITSKNAHALQQTSLEMVKASTTLNSICHRVSAPERGCKYHHNTWGPRMTSLSYVFY